MAIKIREIDCDSPHEEVYIGLEMRYAGHYINGWEEGVSKVIRIFCEKMFDGKNRCKNDTLAPVWAELEAGKLILLGYDSIRIGFFDKRQEWKEHIKL